MASGAAVGEKGHRGTDILNNSRASASGRIFLVTTGTRVSADGPQTSHNTTRRTIRERRRGNWFLDHLSTLCRPLSGIWRRRPRPALRFTAVTTVFLLGRDSQNVSFFPGRSRDVSMLTYLGGPLNGHISQTAQDFPRRSEA